MSVIASVFRSDFNTTSGKVRSLLIPTLVNKSGAIGLSLLPMLLIDKGLSASDSSIVMAVVKASAVIGVFLGASLTDHFVTKRIILASFLVSAVGMLFLPFSNVFISICLFGSLSNIGQTMFPNASQLMFKKILQPHERQEAVAWLRSVNNFGHVLSYSMGVLFAASGTVGFMLFDGVTSLMALFIGNKTLPDDHEHSVRVSVNSVSSESEWNPRGFWLTAVMVGCFAFFYELFMDSSAVKLRGYYGTEGLGIFSQMMLINTVLCALLSVKASQLIKNPVHALPIGMSLALIACITLKSDHKFILYLGAFILTMGEVIFFSLSSFVLISLMPGSKRSGSVFGVATLIPIFAKTVGAASSFYFIQSGLMGSTLLFSVGVMGLVIAFLAAPSWKKIGAS
jgi:MFS family permease